MSMLTQERVREALPALPGWTLTSEGGRSCLRRTIQTGSFIKGLGLVTQIAILAEKADHHPDVLLTYPRVELTLTTHSAGGLTEKDLALAGEISRLVS